MKFKFIGNAGGVFTGSDGTKLLCDPWIVDGVFIFRRPRIDLERSGSRKTIWGIPSSGLSLRVGSPRATKNHENDRFHTAVPN